MPNMVLTLYKSIMDQTETTIFILNDPQVMELEWP
jgi:hypothetical protein